MSRTVAIVGRPNVGKSRLFNRLARRRISIVHDQPGITRDVISAEVKDGSYTLLDTGGLGFQDATTAKELIRDSEHQVEFAIESASLILFVIDGKDELSAIDERIAAMLRKSRKPVLLVVNKVDFDDGALGNSEIYKLGLGQPIPVSAEHGRNEDSLRAAILEKIGPEPAKDEPKEGDAPANERLKICFIGRPNVGKASLSQRLLKSDRLIVSDIPGTTRDAVELDFDFKSRDGKTWPFTLIVTPVLNTATQLRSPRRYFFLLRSLGAIKEVNLVFLVLDAMDGVTQQDKAIAGEVVKEARPIVIVVNKWDLVLKEFSENPPKQYKS